jgi:hypothetical protein
MGVRAVPLAPQARQGKLTASTNPQLATGPQKCVVLGPVGESQKAFKRDPSDVACLVAAILDASTKPVLGSSKSAVWKGSCDQTTTIS